jgi:hypothetical protein
MFAYHNILNGWKATGLNPKHVNLLLVVSRLRSFLGQQKEQQSKEKKQKGEIVDPLAASPRVQRVATTINNLTSLRDKYGTLLSSPSRHVLQQTSIHLDGRW